MFQWAELMQFYLLKASVFPMMISEEMFLTISKLLLQKIAQISTIGGWLVCTISKPKPFCRSTSDPIATTTKVPLVRKYVFTSGRNILRYMFKTVKIGLHHLVTILNECVNASVGGVMFQLVRILISTPGKIVSKIISYV